MMLGKRVKGRVFRSSSAILAAGVLAACASYGYGPVPLASFAVPAARTTVADAPARLGQALFFDKRLSGANDLSCASCHQPDRGFEDGRAIAVGTGGHVGRLATPTLIGVGSASRLMWDGRVKSLEAQALMPIVNPIEMNQSLDGLVVELSGDSQTRAAFAAAFPEQPRVTVANIAAALAAYQRTIQPQPSRFDRFVAGDAAALSATEQRGFTLFAGKAGCAECHRGPLLTDGRLHDIGLPNRGSGTRFKTPTLREIALRAPYMHDGSLATLDAVVAHYADHRTRRAGVRSAVALDPTERAAIVAFLYTLGPVVGPKGPSGSKQK